ncbi:response regulator [Noviherbaspirillum massiliense]|uniref:response regulator n=1 Tax=Noviherbaspirillum massiliense TaxID=1465823 RepID=UPI0003183423|nr:response regulator [Noviherbaspirillum massiliense]
MLFKSQSNTPVYLLVAGTSLLVFLVDLYTRLGVAEWIFYLVPVFLCIFQSHRYLPLLVAGAQILLTAIGFLVSAPGIAADVAFINRVLGMGAVFAVAYLVQRFIGEREQMRRQLWLEQGRVEISRSLMGELGVHEVADNILHALAKYVNAQVGLLYRLDGGTLVPAAAYATDSALPDIPEIKLGQGLAGEVARHGSPMVVSELPEAYLRVNSAVGAASPAHVLIAPITADDRVFGVVELGFVRRSRDLDVELQLLRLVAEKIGMALRSALYRENLRALLEKTQRQSEELQSQQEELRVANEELQEQSRALQESQAQLETQQSELEQTNIQLEERTRLLEKQKRELLFVQQTLENNAIELEKASRYKSEFLANMSHELRTPLNSSLILSHMLAENKQGTLTEEQVNYARTIHASNQDLLALINDILDLSKIEAGHVELKPEPAEVATILDQLRQTFEPVSRQKGVAFILEAGEDVPAFLVTDSQRLQQVLRNLLSNAFKFTEEGEVTLRVDATGGRVRFSVRDTGIGIAEHQQQVIFEAFRQADGSTSRAYGGTGLGLSISRELARLLGGEISVESSLGQGSTFTLEIPVHLAAAPADGEAPGQSPAAGTTRKDEDRTKNARQASVTQARIKPQQNEPAPAAIKDDREQRRHGRLILMVEDDEKFASVLYELAHEMRFDCIHAPSAGEALRLAQEYVPDAILLDVGLPDHSGLSVLERIKRDPATRHIPVHMISVNDYRQTALEMGAVGYALKPVAREELTDAIRKLERKLQNGLRRILIVEDNATLRESLARMLAADDVEIVTAATAAEALDQVSENTFDCMVMDLMLPDASGHDILERMAQGGKYSFPPVIVYTGRALTRDEEQRLRRYSQSIIIKGAKSPERLLDEVSLFLHRVEASLPADQQKLLLQARQRDAVFEYRKILLVEDDVRNIFALTSVFEPLGATLEIARNGREALELLERNPAIDLVLMDLMMPEMDGLTAMREIRKQPQLARLPIIALTAKAMADDRRNCLEAGANDYIAKPIDVDQLVSLCRVWMPK